MSDGILFFLPHNILYCCSTLHCILSGDTRPRLFETVANLFALRFTLFSSPECRWNSIPNGLGDFPCLSFVICFHIVLFLIINSRIGKKSRHGRLLFFDEKIGKNYRKQLFGSYYTYLIGSFLRRITVSCFYIITPLPSPWDLYYFHPLIRFQKYPNALIEMSFLYHL